MMPFYSHFFWPSIIMAKWFIQFSGKLNLMDAFLPPNEFVKPNHNCIYEWENKKCVNNFQINFWHIITQKCIKLFAKYWVKILWIHHLVDSKMGKKPKNLS